MTDEDIRKEVMKPSQHWLDIGQGELGRIHVEVLGCEGLPNMDAGGFMGNKTDTFISIVYEDAFARTDVIDDCLSPQFMPWTNRAFIFSMSHPSSVLNLAAFDFDGGLLDDHDLIGRVSVDISVLLPDTEYVLHYNLHPTNRVSNRPVNGQIKIRLRMEIFDERKLALVALQPPPPIYVNAKKRRDFRVIRETCLGNVDEERYSVSTLKSYVEELQELQYVLFYLEDAAMTLFLWRGHLDIPLFGREIKLPLHSLNAFILSTFLVEHPQLLPSFGFLSIAWIMIAIMGWRRHSENIWQHCYSYFEIMSMVLVGDSLVPPAKIEPYQNFDEAKKEMESWVKRVEDAAAKAERAYAEAQKEEEERQEELEAIGETDIDLGTKTGGGGISIDPVRAALYPIQLMLGVLCRVIRFVKNIFSWQEAFFSFWISTGCIMLSVACLFVPWFWIIQWTARFVVWTIFGPWMKLVDVFYVSRIKPETEEERKLREKAERLKRKLATTEAADRARQVRENATKMKVMKKYYFGKFSMQVPIVKQDRFIDVPLPESSAVPHKEKQLTLAELAMEEAGYNRKRVPGQTLIGDMIPTIAQESFTHAPVGKATAHPERLAKNTPGAAARVGGDSTASAYVKIAGVVLVAILVSYFATPFIVSGFESILSFFHATVMVKTSEL
jgi:C2 domain